MAGRVHQVQHILFAVLGRIVQPHGLRLDGDAAFALDIHIVEHLVGHFTVAQSAAHLNQAIGDSRFAVINMRDDRKVANLV